MVKSLRKLQSVPLIKNTGWLFLSELVARISRLVAIMIMAALMAPELFGIITLTQVLHEFMRVFSRSGAGIKIIQSRESELGNIISHVIALQWLLSCLVAMIQLFLAPYIGAFYQDPHLAHLLELLTITYFLYPLVSAKVLLMQRTNEMRRFALYSCACLTLENTLIVLALLFDAGLYCIVIAKIASAILWVLLFNRHQSLTTNEHVSLVRIIALFRFSVPVYCSELLKLLRSNMDVLFAGRILSPELFGIYSFAKSIGMGFSQSLINAYCNSLLPHICFNKRMDDKCDFLRHVYLATAGIAVMLGIQALLTPLCVSVFFEDQWLQAGKLAGLLCLATIPVLLIDTFSTYCRANNKNKHELFNTLFCIMLSALAIVIIWPTSSESMVLTVLIATCTWLTLFLVSQMPLYKSTFLVKR